MIVVASTKYPLQITHVNCVLISSNRKGRFRVDKSDEVDDDVVFGENEDDVDVGDSADDGNLICNFVSEDDDDEHWVFCFDMIKCFFETNTITLQY